MTSKLTSSTSDVADPVAPKFMLLAEALAARKDALAEISDLRDRLAAAVVRYEDETVPSEQPSDVVAGLTTALDRFEGLSIRINATNNQTNLSFDGRTLSVMEAIALRERLTLEAKARQKAVETIEDAAGTGRAGRGRGFLGGRRTRDELREVPTVDLRAERRVSDELSEKIRRLDLALQ
jgi:hypothetical protein